MTSRASGHRMDRENTRLAVSQTNQQALAASKMKDEACQPASMQSWRDRGWDAE